MNALKNALISVFYKDGLGPVITALSKNNTGIYSTGGTQKFIEELGGKVIPVEEVTGFPGILGGRVKTLHPGVFGAILYRRENESDRRELEKYNIPSIDLVIVDLYPFEETVKGGGSHQQIIEKIDIGGVSLIRAAAKNHEHVLIIPDRGSYPLLLDILEGRVEVTPELRRQLAARAIKLTSAYDQAIGSYLAGEDPRPAFSSPGPLRYGENPHQKGWFYGDIGELFDQLNGKELSYNNLLDIDAAVNLISEFDEPACAILKHNNPCGLAAADTPLRAWKRALAGDPVSAFGGIIIFNRELDTETAEEVNRIFCEVVIAPGYSEEALEVLRQKKNRIILRRKERSLPPRNFRSLLHGILEQERDSYSESTEDLRTVTEKSPTAGQIRDMLFANRIVKHTRSNAIVLVKENQLIGSGVGQTSRIDALKQALDKAKTFNFETEGAVLASDAFFPFSDSVEISGAAGIAAIVQPGGSVKDQESIDAANRLGIAMVFTGHRHFRH